MAHSVNTCKQPFDYISNGCLHSEFLLEDGEWFHPKLYFCDIIIEPRHVMKIGGKCIEKASDTDHFI